MKEDAGFQTLSTNDMPKAGRLTRWNEFISETFADMRVEPENVSDFHASLSRIKIGAMGLSWYSTTASSGLVDVGRVGAWSAPIGEAFLLAVQEVGTTIGHYLGRTIETSPGEMVLLDAGRPWRIESADAMCAVAVKIPADRLLKMISDPESACGIRLGQEIPGIAMAGVLLLEIKNAIAAAPHADWSMYEDVLLSVVAAALQCVPETDRRPTKLGSQRRQACAFIERNLDNPDLDVNVIASELHTSTRSIQRTFGEIGFTPRGYIIERRVDVAADRLKRRDFRDLSITDIAFSVGFNDLSHFIRSFRKKWGMSPRDFRAAHSTGQ